jgi:hypothetical protein
MSRKAMKMYDEGRALTRIALGCVASRVLLMDKGERKHC